ncbi:MAG TPA: ATP-grasp domain-containing protein, partial [Streptosporangiaceae bacterium]
MGEQGRHLAGADLTTPAVVLKLDPNVMHHGGLGVIRSLGRIGVPVYGVHEGPLAPAANSRYLRGRAFWSPGAGDADQIADGLAALSDRIGQRAVLLPTDDAGAIFLAEHGAALRPRFIFPDPPRDLPRQVAGKFSLHELCRELGVPSPAAAVVDPAGPASAAAAREFAARAGYPLIAKLTTPWASSLRSTSILTTPAELDAALGACAHEGAGLMLQEYIPGGRDTDWFFHGYCDATSACRPAFTGVKERSYPAHAGLTS